MMQILTPFIMAVIVVVGFWALCGILALLNEICEPGYSWDIVEFFALFESDFLGTYIVAVVLWLILTIFGELFVASEL